MICMQTRHQGKVTVLDRLEEIALCAVRIFTAHRISVFARKALDSLFGLEMSFDVKQFVLCVDEREGVAGISVHMAIAIGCAAITEENCYLMQRLGRERKEVPHHGWRLEVGLRIALLRMDEIAKLERILDEEDRRVLAEHVPVAFFGVELDGKAARTTLAVSGTLFAACRGETNKQGRGLADLFKELGRCPFGLVGIGAGEVSGSPRTFGMHDAFGDALTVEMRHLFKDRGVLENYGAAGPRSEGILGYRQQEVRRPLSSSCVLR
jgi:hypothetical protein